MGTKAAQPKERQWDGVVRRSLSVTTRAVDEKTRSFEVVASTSTLDSHGDIVEQDWDLDRYKKNPVVFWHHNNFESSRWSFGGACDPEDFLPIGKSEDVRIEGGQLVAKITLLDATEEEEPLVAKIWRRVQQGVLRAVSVGFYVGKVTEEAAPGGVIYRLSECELLEISIVPIPSNPDAVAKAKAFERQQFARLVAGKETVTETGEVHMPMTPEEKAVYDAALTKATTLESDLKAEKAANTKLDTELKAASERAAKAEAANIETEISGLVGKKITPAEKDEHVALAKEIGLERVKGILAKRPDLSLTTPVKVDGEKVAASQPAPAPVAGGDGSADIVQIANKAATAA